MWISKRGYLKQLDSSKYMKDASQVGHIKMLQLNTGVTAGLRAAADGATDPHNLARMGCVCDKQTKRGGESLWFDTCRKSQ